MSDVRDGSMSGPGWTILRSGGRETSGLEIPTFPTEVRAPEGSVRLALGTNGEARVLLPIADGAVTSTVLGASALAVVVSSYAEGSRHCRFLDLTCLSVELESVFSEVVDEILARIERGRDCVDAARSTIEEFRSLLIRPSGADVPAYRIAGLVGELLYLNRLLDRSPQAWKCWRGPAGDRHDFASGTTAVEVKCTMGRGRTTISVNGLEQLEAPSGGILYLQHFELEAAAAGMLSISSLGRGALAKADDPDQVRTLLSALGCDDVDDAAWNSASYRLENEALYKVGEGFPRLVASMLPGGERPPGISDVSYASDLSMAPTHRIEQSRQVEIEEVLLQCH